MDCAVSGGPDSTALVALARAAGLEVTAHHVHHGLRPEADRDAAAAEGVAETVGAAFVLHRVLVEHGPNLEARARAARRGALPADTMTGHTADDQAETFLIRLLRGAGTDGLSAMRPGPTKPLLELRRHETRALCAAMGLPTIDDAMNDDPRFVRTRIRHEMLPLLEDISIRDPVPILVRSADLLRDDAELLDELSASLDPTDARALSAAPVPLARRAVRRWLTVAGYPPDAATVERVLAVARGETRACEVGGGRRVARSAQRLRLGRPVEHPDSLAPGMSTDERPRREI